MTCLLFGTPHLNPLPSRQGERRAETRGSYRTFMHTVSYDALRQRRCAKTKFHSANFLIALAMEATPTRRVENITKPITRHFLIGSTFFFLSGNLVKEGHQRKSECPKRCKRIAKQSLSPRFFESSCLPIDRHTCIRGKSFKQYLCRTRRSTEPRRRTRVMKHTVQTVVVLLVKTPGHSSPMLWQLVNSSMKKKIDGRLVMKPIFSAASI